MPNDPNPPRPGQPDRGGHERGPAVRVQVPPGTPVDDGAGRGGPPNAQPGAPGDGAAQVVVQVQVQPPGRAPAPAPPATSPRGDGAGPDTQRDGQRDGRNGDRRNGGAGAGKDAGNEAGPQDGKPDAKRPEPVRRRTVVIGALVVAGVLAALLLIGFLPRRNRDQKLRARAQETARSDSVPAVQVVPAARGDTVAEFSLPGNVQALHEAAVYARATGYVRRWTADIGQHVRAGQVLAVLDVPDVEEQLREARGQAAQSAAALRLAQVELQRYRALYRDSVITREELDQRQANADAGAANYAASQANVRRLGELVGYASVTAPFSGVVTARNVDNGVLVSGAGATTSPNAAGLGGNTLLGSAGGQATAAGGTSSSAGGAGTGALGGGGSGGGASAAGGGASLFRVAQMDTVRLYVGVPQAYAADVRPRMDASVRVPEMPQRTFRGRVARTAGALDAATRTLLVEVDIPNRDGRLLPGMYALVDFHLAREAPPVTIPSGALVVRTQGPQAAVVGPDSVVHLRPITVGRDFGSSLEVTSGLRAGDAVVVNPTDDLRDEQRVRARRQPQGGAPGGNTPGGRPANPPPVSDSGGGGKGKKGGAGAAGQGAGGAQGSQGGAQGGQGQGGGQGGGQASGAGGAGGGGGNGPGGGAGAGQPAPGQGGAQGGAQGAGGSGGASGQKRPPSVPIGAPGRP